MIATYKILVLRSGALGDCVISFPALRLLRERFPVAEISILGDPYSAPIFQGTPYHDRLELLAHRSSLPRYIWRLLQLRKERFDLILDFQACGRSRVQTVLIGAQRRIGFDKGHFLANVPYTDLVPFNRSVHAARRVAGILEPLGVEVDSAELHSDSGLDPQHQAAATKLLRDSGVKGPYAMLQVTGADRHDNRLWPADRFAAVAEHISRQGMSVVIASRANEPAVNQVIKGSSCPVYNISGATGLPVLASVMGGASLYVGYNTGPMHIAAWLDTPIVALFDRPNDDVEWFPLTAAPSRVVKARTVPEPPGWRLDTVPTDEVVQAVDKVLAEASLNTRPLNAHVVGGKG